MSWIGSSLQSCCLLVFTLCVFHIYWWFGIKKYRFIINDLGGVGGGVMMLDDEKEKKSVGDEVEAGEVELTDNDVSVSICGTTRDGGEA